MENQPSPSFEPVNEEQAATIPYTYPPKYRQQEGKENIWMRSIISLVLYLVLGYYIFPSYKMLLIVTAIVVFHELGHFFAMKYYKYSDLGIFFIPLLGAYVSGTKREVSQKQSAVILLAGPLPGIILGVIFYLMDEHSTYYPFSVPLSSIALIMIFVNLINLFPVYPLDGGQLLNRVFLDEDSWVSRLFVLLSIAFLVWFALFGMSRPVYVLLIVPGMMVFRLFGERQFTAAEKKIEEEGINANTTYEDLPDEDYWRMRNILIEKHAAFKDIPTAPPYEYSQKEEKIMTTIQGLLHRHLIQDVSIIGKIFIFLLWAAAFATPWLIDLDMSFFRRFF